MQSEVKNEFYKFIASKTDDAVFSPQDGYFPFSVIADAFEKGTEHGREALKQKIRNLYIRNIEIAVEAVTNLISDIDTKGYKAKKIYINHSIQQSLVLIAIDDHLNIDESFIEYAYSKVIEIQTAASLENQINITISFIEAANINEDLISLDGYSFVYDFSTNNG